MNEKQCWYRGCEARGETRPLFAHSHNLPAPLRLCDRHLSELARARETAASSIERPNR